MFNIEKFKTPEAKKLMLLGGITIATSVAFSVLPKAASVAALTWGAAVITVRALENRDILTNERQ